MRCTLPKQFKSTASHAFTLVEVLVIAPFVILAIGAFVVVITNLTGETLSTKGTNDLIYDSQNALDTIERDAALATEFRTTTTYNPASPQGAGGNTGYNGTSPLTGTSDRLVMRTLTTNQQPLSDTRAPVYKNVSGSCSTTSLYTVDVVYFLRAGSLWRRIVKDPGSTPCVTPWQIGTCNPDLTPSPPSAVCQAEDIELARNVTAMNIQYLLPNGNPASLSPSITAARITLNLAITAGGRDSTYSNTLHVQRRNSPLPN